MLHQKSDFTRKENGQIIERQKLFSLGLEHRVYSWLQELELSHHYALHPERFDQKMS